MLVMKCRSGWGVAVPAAPTGASAGHEAWREMSVSSQQPLRHGCTGTGRQCSQCRVSEKVSAVSAE